MRPIDLEEFDREVEKLNLPEDLGKATEAQKEKFYMLCSAANAWQERVSERRLKDPAFRAEAAKEFRRMLGEKP